MKIFNTYGFYKEGKTANMDVYDRRGGGLGLWRIGRKIQLHLTVELQRNSYEYDWF